MKAILEELYPKLGSQKAIAEHLGITQGMVSLWMVRFGLRRRTVLVPEREVQP